MFLYIDRQSKYVTTVRANQIRPDAVRVLQHYQPHHGLEEAIKEKKHSDPHSNVDRVRMCDPHSKVDRVERMNDPHSKVDLEKSSVKTNSNKLTSVMAAAATLTQDNGNAANKRGLQRKPRSKANLKFEDHQSNQGTQSTNPKLRSYVMSNNDKEVMDKPIKTLPELEALAN